MFCSLPSPGREAIAFPHFPTRHQAFIFRAYEYVPAERIAKVLKTSVEKIHEAASDMGLPHSDVGDTWLKKGYIMIIRRMWHILPYEQLFELLDTDADSLALIMRDEDFLATKLSKKPICSPVEWRELTDDENARTEEIREIVSALDLSGRKPFDFEYDIPTLKFEGKERFETRIIYAFSGLYQHAFDVDSRVYLPDEQLLAYQRLGINGIWTQGVLTQLRAFPFDPAVSTGYESRLQKMRELTERLDKYGIKLYLYINEPRAMPLQFFEKQENIRGHIRRDNACLCTSTEEVQNYLADSIETICRAVPLIGGFFTITRSENLTNCYSHSGSEDRPCTCPRCKNRSVGEVVAQTVECFLRGARRVSDRIKVFAWSWGWGEHSEQIIRHLPKEVIFLSQSEADMPFEFGGVKGTVADYSMSIVGPGERAKNEWRIAKECGLQTGAKVQINTTWEASTVPAIPVSPSIEGHMRALRGEGGQHLLLSWTLGGYPCRNIAAAAKYFYEKCEYAPSDPSILAAERQFAEAFKAFPFHIHVAYLGPQNAGPSTLLYPTPTGYRATMTCFAYDDLEAWRAIYPEDIFEEQFAKLCEKWKIGLDMLPEKEESETVLMAWATYCLFKSSLNQIRFIRARDDGLHANMAAIAADELQIAEKMLELMNKNAAIGYEAANHYYFSKGQMVEKIINCHYIMSTFDQDKDRYPMS